jgi:sulfonate transport system substrate-binding protein
MSNTTFIRRARALIVLPLLVLAACGDDDKPAADAAASATSPAPAASVSSDAVAAESSTVASTADGSATSAAPSTPPSTDAAAPDIDLTGVTLRVGDQVSLTQTGLEVAGLADTPYTIEWAAFSSGPPMLEAMAADAIDIGGVGDAPPIFAAAAGAEIAPVLATATPQTNQGILVPAGSDITEIADLAGKTVAVAKGSSANWILLKALTDNGLSVDDVDIAYLQPTDAQQAFAGGSVDAWAVWAPFSTLAIEQGARLIVTGADLGIPGLGFQVASDAALADPAKEAAIRDYLGRLRAAQEWQRENKGAWAAKYSELTGLPIELAEQLLAAESTATPIDDEVVGALQAEADAFFAAGLIPDEVDIAGTVDTRFNDVTPAS